MVTNFIWMSFSYRLRCEQMTFFCHVVNLPTVIVYIVRNSSLICHKLRHTFILPHKHTEKPFLLYIEERFNLLLAYCFCPSLLSFETCSLAQVLAPIHLHLSIQVRLLGFIGPVPPPARDKRVSVPTYTKEMIFICQLIFTFSWKFFSIRLKWNINKEIMHSHKQKEINSIHYLYNCVILLLGITRNISLNEKDGI